MSKMREAFESYAKTFAAPLSLHRSGDDYGNGETAIAWHDFKAGYQAAIAAVKERDRVIIWRCKLWGGEAVRCIPLLEELPED